MSMETAVQKLCKWRSVFAGWQLGTRPKDDAECNAVRDHREVTMLLRVETTAIIGLLLKKGIVTLAEVQAEIGQESEHLDKAYEAKFPGFSTSLLGVNMDVKKAAETMRRMNFKS